jgi:hypothetical protein
MSNPQTAAEWKQVVANAEAQKKIANDRNAALSATALELNIAKAEAVTRTQNAKTAEERAAGFAAQKEILLAQRQLRADQASVLAEVEGYNTTIANANTQAGIALTGPPNTSANTPPETVVPNQTNTTVTTETIPPIENSTPATTTDPNSDPNTNIGSEPVVENATPAFVTGQNAAADAAFQEANASEQQLIDPNSDPNTNIGNDSQEPPPQPQQTISLASDPNTNIGTEGQTITSPNSITENVFDPRQEVTENVFDPRQEVTENVFDPTSGGAGGYRGLQGSTNAARSQQTAQDAANAKTQGDWRVRLSLAPSANYLYKAANPGILKYLQETNGVVFPYTPSIQITYAANYETADIVHTNYKLVQYKNSSVDQLSITCDFTAQDTYEANYLLAVIHFFKSVTKMFYGRDEIPKPGTPPPLCYLSGLGSFQFDDHPLVINTFNYSLPTDVDYIRAGSPTLQPGIDSSAYNGSIGAESTPGSIRRGPLNPGATKNSPQFTQPTNTQPTYVPTKMQITITAFPIVTRNDISNNFSLQKYATGSLLQGSKNPSGGGIW